MTKKTWLKKMIAFYERGIEYCEKEGWSNDNIRSCGIRGLCIASYTIGMGFAAPKIFFPDHPATTFWWQEFTTREGVMIRYTFLLLEMEALKK